MCSSDLATFHLKHKGYALGNNAKLDDIKNIIQGSALNKFLFRYPTQSINYVECHDNHTFFDKAIKAVDDETIEQIKKRQRLATSMVILSQGVPFIHNGQEFYRSKNGVENSYRSKDAINQVNWDLVDENIDDIKFIKELIKVRKKYSLLRLQAPSQIKRHTNVKIHESGTIEYCLKDDVLEIKIFFKNSFKEETIQLDGTYNLTFDGVKK